MGKFIDITGQKFGKLTILNREGSDKTNRPLWNCLCECGNTCIVKAACLKGGYTKSCGCLYGKSKETHKATHTPEYNIWQHIKKRCLNCTVIGYKNYGGRGIKICDRWINSFENFLEDMGKRPSKEYSIDRIDNNGNYEPGNCRWATRKEQARNQRSNRKVINTKTNEIFNTVADAAESINMRYGHLKQQLDEIYKNKTNFKYY